MVLVFRTYSTNTIYKGPCQISVMEIFEKSLYVFPQKSPSLIESEAVILFVVVIKNNVF